MKPKSTKVKPEVNKAMLELDAIDTVRFELVAAVKNGASNIEVSEIHARLISLYASLDLHNIESIIHKIQYKAA